ncbi:RNA-directed RNA polymerase, partial [Tanacetum coccineum]
MIEVFNPTNRGYLASFVLITLSICGVYYLGHALIADNVDVPITQISKVALKDTGTDTVSAKCKNECRPSGSEVWPEGIVAKTSDLDMRPMRDSTNKKAHSHHSKSLLAIAAGVKQKDLVDKIITKFLQSGFIVMVFHYDGIVDQWNDLGWVSDVIHVSAVDQTKWWFAKRFLHPDIVSEYDYLFLWDEDLEVDHFDPGRYLTIVKEEGLDLSQPALDRGKSGIHHHITAHRKNSKVHSWVEMMVPVFSKAAWRCAWYLIQGDRKKKVGVVDAEYIVHLGLATLGGSNYKGSGDIHPGNDRVEVRKQSYNEMHVFRQRWHQAVKGDKCWIDRYRDT